MLKREKEVFGYLLKNEEDVMRTLERQYKKALKDIETCIKVLQADELTQSRIYRLEYQKTLKKQVEAILEKLHSDEYTSMNQYLSGTYTDAYVGTAYALHGQSVPVLMPIDHRAAVKAVMTDSKISTDLYTHLGVDITKLKKNIRNEITRGIASGMLWNDIARNVSYNSNITLNRAKNIVQTEGHRIQQASAHDARHHAISRGADLVKQWDATLDMRTRDSHRKLDGQIREVDEPFEIDGKEAQYPGGFGDPSEDCRCRCVALSRARSALDEAELETMKERAAFWELDKTENFEDFKKKYLKATEALKNQEESGIIRYAKGGKIAIPEQKFTGYALKEPDKAKAFKTALGYDQSNAEELIQNIVDHIDKNKFVQKGDAGHGMRYEYIMRIVGANGKEANVLTAWIEEGGGLRMTSVYVTKRKVTE